MMKWFTTRYEANDHSPNRRPQKKTSKQNNLSIYNRLFYLLLQFEC